MSLIVLKNNKPFTNSLILSQGCEVEHRSVLQLIRKYKERKIFQTSAFQMQRLKTKGRQTEYYLLSESQAIFLITLMNNSDKVLDFKEALVNAFIEHRDFAASMVVQQQNKNWIDKRQETKIMRRELTDMIQKFIIYAESQGSKSAKMYYMNISKLELTGLFLMEQKYPNARHVMSFRQLNLIEMADEAVARALDEAMTQGLHYKECYKYAKERIELLAKIFPPSPLPQLLSQQVATKSLTM